MDPRIRIHPEMSWIRNTAVEDAAHHSLHSSRGGGGSDKDRRAEKKHKHKERERGEKERGEKERGEKERGEKERWERERGERERGEKERGERERGEKERGEKERGEKERGEKERGERERGEKERDEKERRGHHHKSKKSHRDREAGEERITVKEEKEVNHTAVEIEHRVKKHESSRLSHHQPGGSKQELESVVKRSKSAHRDEEGRSASSAEKHRSRRDGEADGTHCDDIRDKSRTKERSNGGGRREAEIRVKTEPPDCLDEPHSGKYQKCP
jgi:hypothetical protein